jgi:hypothetical protein
MAPPPARAIAIAVELQTLHGVVCVGWGSRKTGKRVYHKTPCLSVHVGRKGEKTGRTLPDTLEGLRQLDLRKARNRPLPRFIDGFRIDVLHAGRPKLHSLAATERLRAGSFGTSTPTIVTKDGEDALALVSGHGVLNASTVRLGGVDGSVIRGDFGGGLSVDWALVRFRGAAADVDGTHPAADDRAPLRLGSGLANGARVEQFSGQRGIPVQGILQGIVPTNINFNGSIYSSLLSILRLKNGPSFSVDGDSGSLIVDEQGNAVAAVVGGDIRADTFYAYDLRGLEGELSAAELRFFFRN